MDSFTGVAACGVYVWQLLDGSQHPASCYLHSFKHSFQVQAGLSDL